MVKSITRQKFVLLLISSIFMAVLVVNYFYFSNAHDGDIEKAKETSLLFYEEAHSLKSPSFLENENFSLAYSIGEAYAVFSNSSEVCKLNHKSPIISASLSLEGNFAISSFESGYKGSVTVYNSQIMPIYKWYSGESYLLSSSINEEGTKILSLCLCENGSLLHLHSIDSEDEILKFYIYDELCYKAYFGENEEILVYSKENIYHYSNKGDLISLSPFDKNLLSDF